MPCFNIRFIEDSESGQIVAIVPKKYIDTSEKGKIKLKKESKNIVSNINYKRYWINTTGQLVLEIKAAKNESDSKN